MRSTPHPLLAALAVALAAAAGLWAGIALALYVALEPVRLVAHLIGA